MASRSQPASRKNPKRPVDWDEYFKNGPPKEIIVIDDSPPPQPAPSGGSRQQPSTVSRTAHMTGHYNLANGSGGQILHTDKKRKTTQYDPGYPDHHSYSSTQTPHAYGSPTTLSTHSSTVSINGNSSTAATSLGSTGIGTAGPSYAPQAAAAATVGPKRKRVTRASHAAAANTNLDAFASYHPPPKPPIKAKDVYVMQVQDVGVISVFFLYLSPFGQRIQEPSKVFSQEAFHPFLYLMLLFSGRILWGYADVTRVE